MSKFNVLITGACGFLGSVLVRQAVDAGMHVTATDRAVLSKLNWHDFVIADILNPLSLSNTCNGVDCVCHVAGLAHIFNSTLLPEDSFYKINVVGTENMARAAIQAGIKHFVFVSSVSVYGGVAHGKDELSDCDPEGPYAESKWQAERRLIDLCQSAAVNLTILRLATLYGEEDPGNVGRLIEKIAHGRFIWVGKGENLKSLLHRDDAARACIKVMQSPLPGIHIFNVTADARKMSDVVQEISSSLQKSIPSWHIPESFALASARVAQSLSMNHAKFSSLYKMLQKWIADDYYNGDKFYRYFNFQAKVGLEEGIQREVTWYKNSFRI